jgi:outer membrane receptor protein involved in Fe transport
MGKRFLTFMIAAFSSMQLFSQSVEGIIINAENKNPVADVNIAVKNSTIGTVSDRNGIFSLEAKNEENYTIQISCIGFESKEINIKTQRNTEKIEIQLQPVSIQLNKSIVVTATKKELVSFETPDAVSVLTSLELKNNAPRSTAEALIGTTGVWMQKTNHGGGSPIVRGLTGNQTLLLIDGISVDEEFGEVTLKPSSLVSNINMQYFTSPTQQFILSLNSAFRAPNINDISTFGLFDYGIEIPSTDLKPEKSITIEGGYKRYTDIISVALSAYNTSLRNLIERVESNYNGSDFIDGERVYKKENVSKANISGIEFESGIKINPQFSFINNITWTYGKNLENDEPMRRIPPLNGKLALQYSKSKIFAEAEYLFAAKQDRLSQGDIDDHRIPEGGTPGWNIFNLKAGYSWKIISLNAGLQNIFNQAYRLHGSGIDGFGRSFWLTLQFEI